MTSAGLWRINAFTVESSTCVVFALQRDTGQAGVVVESAADLASCASCAAIKKSSSSHHGTLGESVKVLCRDSLGIHVLSATYVLCGGCQVEDCRNVSLWVCMGRTTWRNLTSPFLDTKCGNSRNSGKLRDKLGKLGDRRNVSRSSNAKRNGGDDETRTRDLCRDRAAF